MLGQNSDSLGEFTTSDQGPRILVNPSAEELKKMALSQKAKRTEYDSVSIVTDLKSRSADFTRTSVDRTLKSEDFTVIENLGSFLKDKTLIRLDLTMCPEGGALSMHCRLFVDADYAYLAYMAKRSLAPCDHPDGHPDLTVVDIPSWKLGDRRILVDHTIWTTFVLGSDYYGEIKKGFLRMTMYKGKLAGGLGLHAGSKRLFARSTKTRNVRPYGLLLFGLSGTGKTSLTCHDYGCTDAGEKNEILQDDVVLLMPDGKAIGSEGGGFYIKTEGLTPEEQPILYFAATQKDSTLENVSVNANGKVDFLDSSFSKNGRCIARIADIKGMGPSLNLDKVDACVFITRHPLVPPLAKLTPEQGAVAFMLGESIKTSAADPNAKGEPVRCVGTNPFTMGDLGEEGNRMYDLIKKARIECFLLNTGNVGPKELKKKITIGDSTTLLRALVRDAIEWKKDPLLNFEVPFKVFGESLETRLDMHKVWDAKTLEDEYKKVHAERKKWIDKFPTLKPEIVKALY